MPLHFVEEKSAGEVYVALKGKQLGDEALHGKFDELRAYLSERADKPWLDIDLSNNPWVTDVGIRSFALPFLVEYGWVLRLRLFGTAIGGPGLRCLAPLIRAGWVQELHLSHLKSKPTEAEVVSLLWEVKESGRYPQYGTLPLLLRLERNQLDVDVIMHEAKEMGLTFRSGPMDELEPSRTTAAKEKFDAEKVEAMVDFPLLEDQWLQAVPPSTPPQTRSKSAAVVATSSSQPPPPPPPPPELQPPPPPPPPKAAPAKGLPKPPPKAPPKALPQAAPKAPLPKAVKVLTPQLLISSQKLNAKLLTSRPKVHGAPKPRPAGPKPGQALAKPRPRPRAPSAPPPSHRMPPPPPPPLPEETPQLRPRNEAEENPEACRHPTTRQDPLKAFRGRAKPTQTEETNRVKMQDEDEEEWVEWRPTTKDPPQHSPPHAKEPAWASAEWRDWPKEQPWKADWQWDWKVNDSAKSQEEREWVDWRLKASDSHSQWADWKVHGDKSWTEVHNNKSWTEDTYSRHSKDSSMDETYADSYRSTSEDLDEGHWDEPDDVEQQIRENQRIAEKWINKEEAMSEDSERGSRVESPPRSLRGLSLVRQKPPPPSPGAGVLQPQEPNHPPPAKKKKCRTGGGAKARAAARRASSKAPAKTAKTKPLSKWLKTSSRGNEGKECQLMKVPVSEILFSQESCLDHFQDGRPVKETLDALLSGKMTVDHKIFRAMTLVETSAGLKTKDNRRLRCLKDYEEKIGRPVSIVANVWSWKAWRQLFGFFQNDDGTDGRDIRVRTKKRKLAVKEEVKEEVDEMVDEVKSKASDWSPDRQ